MRRGVYSYSYDMLQKANMICVGCQIGQTSIPLAGDMMMEIVSPQRSSKRTQGHQHEHILNVTSLQQSEPGLSEGTEMSTEMQKEKREHKREMESSSTQNTDTRRRENREEICLNIRKRKRRKRNGVREQR